MTGTEHFIASLVGSLAWPAAVLGIAVLFRRQLGELLSTSLRRLKAGPLEFEFERVISTVEAELGREPSFPGERSKGMASPGTTGNGDRGALLEALAPLARTSPNAAVLEAHSQLEHELWEITKNLGVERDLRGAIPLARLAREDGVITPEAENAIVGVTTLRNLAAHGRQAEVSVERAMDYLALVDAVLFTLR